MADDDKKPTQPRVTTDKKVAGSKGDEADAHFISGTGVAEVERGGKKVQVMTDQPANFQSDADLGKTDDK